MVTAFWSIDLQRILFDSAILKSLLFHSLLKILFFLFSYIRQHRLNYNYQ
nr:MAG TPA: hypothetical protein [Caudoviricetes sp.]